MPAGDIVQSEERRKLNLSAILKEVPLSISKKTDFNHFCQAILI